MMPDLRVISAALVILVGSSVSTTYATPLAPTGSHYAGRPSDTGFAGVSNLGGYQTTLDIDLPPARGGSTIPVGLVYGGGRRVGVAGIGWELPLSFVRVDSSFAHRRPKFGLQAPTGREAVLVTIAGATTVMGRSGSVDSHGHRVWIARDEAAAWTLTAEDDNSWHLHDGNGEEYVFARPIATVSNDLWLLTSIISPTNRVKFVYNVGTRAFPTDNGVDCDHLSRLDCATGVGVEIDLARIYYNQHPTTPDCWKNEISFEYAADRNEPLSLSLLGSLPITRSHTLQTLTTLGRTGCNASPQQIRRYEFSYDNDPDTRNPRLRSVRMNGRDGSAAIPLGQFEYGTATTQGQLGYALVGSISLPSDALTTAPTPMASTEFDSDTHDGTSWRNLIDVTGDGRPDVVFRHGNQLWVARNYPSPGGTRFDVPVQLTDNTLEAGPLSSDTDYTVNVDPNNSRYRNDTWRKTIDINGDGRLDVIDARESDDKWTIYLNTPGSPVMWIKRQVSVASLRTQLTARGHVIDGPYVPLTRKSTGFDTEVDECWKWDGANWSFDEIVIRCGGGAAVQRKLTGEKSITEWDLMDMNGDGYPDFLFAGAPASHWFKPDNPSEPNGNSFAKRMTVRRAFATRDLEYGVPAAIYAAFNTVGVRISEQGLFAAPTEIGTSSGCGLITWRDDDQGVQQQDCGIEDVNGDGLLDRVQTNRVFLGDGRSLTASLTSLKLPGPIEARNPRDQACSHQDEFFVTRWSGLRDLTGDGIADYVGTGRVDPDGDGIPSQLSGVWIGTGTGFRPPVPSALLASSTREDCAGRFSRTEGGLYDIDGDGRAEFLRANSTTNTWEVWRLAGIPNSGLLTAIENGYGARTSISYRSAKDDNTTEHNVPFSEIVVSAVQTTGTYGLGGSLQEVRYAYGNAEMFFDPMLDAFTIRAYGRSVAVYGTGPRPGAAAFAVVRDTIKLAPFVAMTDETERRARYLRVGRTSDTYTLARGVPRDPWTLLTLNALGDSRVIGGEHATWKLKLIQVAITAGPDEDCADVMYPYDWPTSWTTNTAGGVYSCNARGVSYLAGSSAWSGTAPPLANFNNVERRTEVAAVDDFGRPTAMREFKDTSRTDDDVCIETAYASPVASISRFAVAARKLTDCNAERSRTLALETFEYDGLAPGEVMAGNLTSYVVDRYATDNGQSLGRVREFAASYDDVGNPRFVVSARSDGAIRSVEIGYDLFSLAIVRTSVSASDVPTLVTETIRDPLSLSEIGGREPNGTAWTRKTDGYDREIAIGMQPPAGSGSTGGLVSTTEYIAFEAGAPAGRTVATTFFADPVGTPNVGSGRTTTTMLDELGRVRRIETSLGPDYADRALVVNRSYDELGRVRFESDPFPTSQDETSVYGTTFHFGSDGQLQCSIRGNGPQPLTFVADSTREVFPTCIARRYANHQLTVSVRSPDSTVANTPQAGVMRSETVTAAGRIVSRETTKNGVRLELSSHDYDRLGNLTRLTRYRAPATSAEPVVWGARIDSTGRVLSATAPGIASRSFAYSNWGELLSTSWTDTSGGSQVTKQIRSSFDALGRVLRTYERENGSVLPDTVSEWIYDRRDAAAPIDASYPLGRLTATKSPVGEIYLGYNPYGRVEQRAFVRDGEKYFERTRYHYDGTPSLVEHSLPDTGNGSERYSYHFDSAGQLVRVLDPGSGEAFYKARSVDAFGRVLKASYGAAEEITVDADYAPSGRRLPRTTAVNASGSTRRIVYEAFDAVGRESQRTEFIDGGQRTVRTGYDSLGQLATQRVQIPGENLRYRSFAYDALGNILELASSDTGSAYLTSDSLDRDRMCRVSYGAPSAGPCNVVHDAMGNVIEQPTPTSVRKIQYSPSGAVRSMVEGNLSAKFRFDGSGEISETRVEGASATDPREDVRLGPFTRRRVGTESVIVRDIPGVGSRKGKGEIVFPFGEARGVRVGVSLSTNKFVQDVQYEPYGEALSVGAKPGEPPYTNNQWNGGDLLADFGVVHLGARLYDPVVGRFVSRDPLLIPRSATTTNPYAFSYNDPVNFSDPTGLCGQIGEELCPQDPPPRGGSSSGGGGQSGGPPWSFVPPKARLVAGPTSSVPGASDTDAGRRLFWTTFIASPFTFNDIPSGFNWDSAAASGLTPGDVIERTLEPTTLGGIRAAADAVATEVGFGIALGPLSRLRLIKYGLTGIGVIAGSHNVYRGIRDGDPLKVIGGASMLVLAGAGSLGGCKGGVCPCFVAGTRIDNETGGVPIEKTRLGERVGPELDVCASDLADWREIDLEMTVLNQGRTDHVEVRLLRPDHWIDAHDARIGGAIRVRLDDLNVEGLARVTNIGATGHVAPGTRCPVTGWIRHMSYDVISLTVGDETLGVTRHHRLFSDDREGWVAASDLRLGERLATRDGIIHVANVGRSSGTPVEVFNLEIYGAHEYYVGSHRALVHNNYSEFPQSAVPKSYMNVDLIVDMEGARGLSGSVVNAFGEVRNANYFWRQLLARRPEMFSPRNRFRITGLGDKPVSPRVDPTWIKYNPTHQSFRGDVLDHHHITHSRYAVPLPQQVHRGWSGSLHETAQ